MKYFSQFIEINNINMYIFKLLKVSIPEIVRIAETEAGQTGTGQTGVGQTEVEQTGVGQTEVGQTDVEQTEAGQTEIVLGMLGAAGRPELEQHERGRILS